MPDLSGIKRLSIDTDTELTSDVQEALNQLRINLMFCGNDVKKIMITSSLPNEGKSFISFYLWKMIAETGKRVLLVDCDLRKSEIRTRYGLKYDGEEFMGMSHYLSGQADLMDVIYATDVKHGFILPVTNNIVNPAILLERPRLKEFFDSVGNVFNYVIIDTPPVLAVADALTVSKYCDGSLLVIRSEETTRKAVETSMGSLERAGIPLLGTVLNRVDPNPRKYYYRNKYYGYGYGYQGDYLEKKTSAKGKLGTKRKKGEKEYEKTSG